MGAQTQLYKWYPLRNVVNYNGTTLFHFSIGCFGIILGYGFSIPGYVLGFLYLGFAMGQMYVLMPLKVCPNCVYYRMEGSRCISSLNMLAKKIASPGDAKNFPQRGEGLLCHNNLYMAALFSPILIMLPAVIFNFSPLLLAAFLGVIGLLVYRMFYIFPKVACVHCYAKQHCPNAIAMGLNKK